ncbi:MAG: amidohydrolase family protein [Candidatus Latescibacterota bacterium]|nr:amidohydrolase family protein [Candidatus Latescibacterota bacterium]
MIIEWNTHIFHPDSGRYPFHARAAYRPTIADEGDPLGDYKQVMVDEGIDRAVLVHPEPYGDDHCLVLECLDREPDLFLGTSLYYPDDADGPRKLEELVRQQPKIIATRFHAHRGKSMYLEDFADAGVRALWEKAVGLGLIIELHIGPDYAEQVAQVLRDIPETTTLIDHLAEPHMGDPIEFAHVLDLAMFDNVYMKMSGLNHFAADAPLYESVRPFTRRVINAFGPERMVWGSGTPAIVDAHMEAYSDADRAKVKGGNLEKLLGWDVTEAAT